MRREDMPAPRGAIRLADDDMDMRLRLTVRARDIADERECLNLLIERDFFVVFPVAVEVAEYHIAEGANADDLIRRDIVRLSECLQPGDHLIALVEDDR